MIYANAETNVRPSRVRKKSVKFQDAASEEELFKKPSRKLAGLSPITQLSSTQNKFLSTTPNLLSPSEKSDVRGRCNQGSPRPVASFSAAFANNPITNTTPALTKKLNDSPEMAGGTAGRSATGSLKLKFHLGSLPSVDMQGFAKAEQGNVVTQDSLSALDVSTALDNSEIPKVCSSLAQALLEPLAVKTESRKPSKQRKRTLSKTSDETSAESECDVPVYANTEIMATKLKTSREKQAGKGGKKYKDDKSKKSSRGVSAYVLYGRSERKKVITENPGADFSEVSRLLAERWQNLREKEKAQWKRRATTAWRKQVHEENLEVTGSMIKGYSPKAVKSTGGLLKTTGPTSKDSTRSSLMFGSEPIDVAAYLSILGESLSTIGSRLLQRQAHLNVPVQGAMPVMLDFLLCSLNCLLCLTNQLSETSACSPQLLTRLLDDVAYIMPDV